MSDQMKSTPALDNVINGATTAEEIRELMKQQLVREGRIQRDRESLGRGVCALPRPQQTSDVPSSASPYKFERIVRWAESTGKRPLIIRANSQAELDALERQVTS